MCPTQDSSESDVEIQIPEPTRWDGTVCLDWGLCHDVQCNVVTKENKWSDHKLLHRSIHHIGISRIRIRKFAPRPNLAKPENVTQDRWNDVLRQNWHLLEDEIPKDSTWERLCGVTQIACTKALEILAPERRQPKKGHKGQVAETIDVYRHHKTNPEGELTIRFKRIQRLWRRLQAFKAGDTNPDLGRAILRESRFLTKQALGLDQTSIHALAKWITQELDLICQTEKNGRIQQWKNKILTDEKFGWKLVSRHKKVISSNCITTEKGEVLFNDELFQHTENYWRAVWPQAENLVTEQTLRELAKDPNTYPVPFPPSFPTLRGIDFREAAARRIHKAAGPDSWSRQEICALPDTCLVLFADRFNRHEQSGRPWPQVLCQWRQVPKKFPAQGIADFRPISIGSNWYRLWSSIRIRQLSDWIKNLAGNEFHGGIRGRSPFTALIHPLCELQHAQKLDSAGIVHRARANLRYIGASDLSKSKAYDRMHGRLAGKALNRLGVPEALARTWEKAWTQQSRFFQFGEQISKRDLCEINCLPQGGPASPFGLMGPLWEAQCRIKKKFHQRQWGRSVFRVFVDDRSWFCSKASTCVAISKEWKAEVKLLGLNENKCKSEFAAVGKISHRRALNLQIRAAGLDVSCLDRPKILGARFECTGAWLGPQQEETTNQAQAIQIAQAAEKLPGTYPQKAMWVKGAAISKFCVPTLSRLPSIKQVRSVQSAVNSALLSAGHRRGGPLALMFHGHTASVNFVAGYHVSLQVATSHQDPVIDQGWSVRRTNGPVHLCRRWFQRRRWVEKARWTWEHSINGDVIAPLRPPVTLGNPHHRNAHVYHLRSGHTEELGHVLREGWRAVLWKQFVAANRRGQELAHLHWLDVSYSFKLATQLLKLVPTNLFSHAKAVLCAHVISPAAFEQKKVLPDQIRCPFCSAKVLAHFHHVMWQCPCFIATRPIWTVSILEANLGWPEPETPKDHALKALLHMAGVRASILEWRHGGTQSAGD